jgi:hypothetical protein
VPTEAKRSDLPHKTVLLPATGQSDNYGNPTTGTPEEIDSRWEKGQQTVQQALTSNKLDVATVFLDREVPADSLLWRGTLEEYNGTGSPEDLYKVIQTSVIDDIKGLHTEYRVLAQSTHDNIPSG